MIGGVRQGQARKLTCPVMIPGGVLLTPPGVGHIFNILYCTKSIISQSSICFLTFQYRKFLVLEVVTILLNQKCSIGTNKAEYADCNIKYGISCYQQDNHTISLLDFGKCRVISRSQYPCSYLCLYLGINYNHTSLHHDV